MTPLESDPGWTYVLAAVGVLIVGVLGASASVLVAWLPIRNDRALANQEADLLTKLDPNDPIVKDLKRLIDARITRWTLKAFRKDTASGKEVTRGAGSLLEAMLGMTIGLSMAGVILLVGDLPPGADAAEVGGTVFLLLGVGGFVTAIAVHAAKRMTQ